MPTFTNPRVSTDDKSLSLLIDVDGKTAKIFWEQKARHYGYVFLGPDFEDLVPPVFVPADPDVGRPEPLPLRGFTGDPEVLRLYDEMMEADRRGEWSE